MGASIKTQRRMGAALDRLGHQGKPVFRARLAAAYEQEAIAEKRAARAQPAPVGTVVTSHVSLEDAAAVHWTPAQLNALRVELREAFDRVINDPAAIDAINIEIGERSLALEPTDPRGCALRSVQCSLDALYAVTR